MRAIGSNELEYLNVKKTFGKQMETFWRIWDKWNSNKRPGMVKAKDEGMGVDEEMVDNSTGDIDGAATTEKNAGRK